MKNTFILSTLSYIFAPILVGSFAFAFAFSALASAPSLSTGGVLAVSGSCAMLQGTANSNISQTRWFEIKEVNRTMEPVMVSVNSSWGSSYYSSGASTNGIFKAEAKRLVPDTDYVYRAVAQNKDGIAYGQEYSFRTKSYKYQKSQNGDSFTDCSSYVPMTTNESVMVDGTTGFAMYSYTSNNNSVGQSYTGGQYTSGVNTTSFNPHTLNQTLVTLNATDITDVSARLNARTYPTQNIQQYGYFEWGKTTSLGNSTQNLSLGIGANLLLSVVIGNLESGTTYYFKPVVSNQIGTADAPMYRFTTAGASAIATESGQLSYNPATVQYYSTPSSVKTNTPSVVSSIKKDKTLLLTDESEIKSVAPSSIMRQTFTIENTTGGNLTNVEIKSVLPMNTDFVAKNSDPFVQKGQLITLALEDMKAGQKISVVYWLKVQDDTKDKTSLETTFIANAKSADGVDIKNFLETSIIVDVALIATQNGAGAAFSGNYNSIYPHTLSDWFTIITLIGLMVTGYIGWKYFMAMKEDKDEDGIPDILAPERVEVRPSAPPAEYVASAIPQKPSEISAVLDNFYSQHHTVKKEPPENLPV